MMRAGQLLGLHRIAPSRALRAAGRSAPRVAPPAAWRMRRSVGAEGGEPAALFLGCVGHLMFSGASHAACGTLAAGGYRVTTPPEQGCCGALARAQRRSRRRARAGRLDDPVVRRQRPGPIVTTAGGCGAFMADYGLLLGTPEARPSARECATTRRCSRRATSARHGPPLRVAYQDSCHLRNGQKVTLEPRALLASLPGVEVVDLPSAGRCCGAAGTYALMRPDDSLRFLDAEARRDRRGGGGRDRQRQPRLPAAVPAGRPAREPARRPRAAHRGAAWPSACRGSRRAPGTLRA